MAAVWFILGFLSIVYGATVMALGSGTPFFAVWYAIGAFFLAMGLAVHTGIWQAIPLAVRRLGAVTLAALLVLLLSLQALALSQAQASGEPGLDYVVVLGAQIRKDGSPSPVLRYRLDAALNYLRENPDTLCIVSGGQGFNEPCPEADGMAAYLEQQGLADERIIRERRSKNTKQNITCSQALMRPGARRVGIVTNNFHVFRAMRLARKAGLTDACGIAGYSTPYYLPNNLLRESLGIAKDFLAGNL